jgi:hypothetical protein
MKFVFSKSNSILDIPILKLKQDKEECLFFIEGCISESNNDKGLVYVVFLKFENENVHEVEQRTILVSTDEIDISFFIDNCLDCSNWQDLTLYVFEFISYKEAFEYCLDLQEGF